jgi:YidC/Oxa1 family membrane protein insertase
VVNPLAILEDPLRNLLIFLHDKAHLTYGWSIVVLTVIVRLIILPLFVTQYRSARRMQEISPQLKQMQAKYKGDKRKQQEEMMRLFQENKVNPFGSCLPMVVQIPVFISLYYVLKDFSNRVLPHSADQNLSFMWVFDDISQQFRSIGWPALLIAAIYGVTQLLATEVSMATTPQTSDWQRKLFRIMPLFIVLGLFIYPNVPAGLVLYWMTTNLWTCGQQVVLKRRLGPLQLAQTIPADVVVEPAGAAAAASVVTAKPKQKAPPPAKPAVVEGESAPAQAPAKSSTGKTRSQQKGGGQGGQRRRPPKKR